VDDGDTTTATTTKASKEPVDPGTKTPPNPPVVTPTPVIPTTGPPAREGAVTGRG
jgi:hypothetical protein